MEPVADDGNRFMGVLVGELTDLLDRLCVDLALYLGDINHRRRAVGDRNCFIAADDRHVWAAGRGDASAHAGDAHAAGRCRLPRSRRSAGRHDLARLHAFRRDDPAHDRTNHHEDYDQAEHRHDAEFGATHDVVLGELQVAHPASRLVDRRGGGFSEAQIDDFDLVAALGIEADSRTDQCSDAIDFFFRPRLVGEFTLVVLGVNTVDQYGRRNPVDAPGFNHLGLGRARNFLVDDFLGFFALITLGSALGLWFAARQFGAGRYGAFFVVARGRLLFAGLARPQDPAIRIEFIRSLRDAIDVEIRIDLHARVTRADHR